MSFEKRYNYEIGIYYKKQTSFDTMKKNLLNWKKIKYNNISTSTSNTSISSMNWSIDGVELVFDNIDNCGFIAVFRYETMNYYKIEMFDYLDKISLYNLKRRKDITDLYLSKSHHLIEDYTKIVNRLYRMHCDLTIKNENFKDETFYAILYLDLLKLVNEMKSLVF